MRISVKGLSIASGLLWGGCMLLVGFMHQTSPSYGSSFLQAVSSIYPGFEGGANVIDVLVGTVYGFFDGLIGGALLGWLYNCFAVCHGKQG